MRTRHGIIVQYAALLTCAIMLSYIFGPSMAAQAREPIPSAANSPSPTQQAAGHNSTITKDTSAQPTTTNTPSNETHPIGTQGATACSTALQNWLGLEYTMCSSGSDFVLELASGPVPACMNYTNFPWHDDTRITKVVIDQGVYMTNVLYSGYAMFYNLANLKTADVSGLDTSASTSLSYLFGNCPKLETVTGLERLNTGNVTTLWGMFMNDASLVGSLDSGPDKTPNGRTLDLSTWNTSKVALTYGMFQGCRSLESLDISGWSLNHETRADTETMFQDCPRLFRIKVGPNTQFGEYSFYMGSTDAPIYKDSTKTREFSNNKAPNFTVDSPTWLYLTFGYDANGGTKSLCDSIAMPNEPINCTITKPGNRQVGWSTQPNGGGDQYPLGEKRPYVPYISNGSAPSTGKLYPVWQPLSQPTINAVTPKADGSLDVKGTGSGNTLPGDKFTVTPYKDTTTTNHGATVEGTPDTAGGSAWTGHYAAGDNPYTHLADADTVGAGIGLYLTSMLNDETSLISSRKLFTVDLIAPGIENLATGERQPTSGPGVNGTIRGTVWTSGDRTAQPNRTREGNDLVTVTWPDGTTSTTRSSTDGSFIIDIPASVPLDGRNATVIAQDNADGNGANRPAGYENRPNKSRAYNVRLLQTVASLPFTGHEAQPVKYLFVGLAATLALTTGAILRYYARRHHVTKL
jgi:hypothetical protein